MSEEKKDTEEVVSNQADTSVVAKKDTKIEEKKTVEKTPDKKDKKEEKLKKKHKKKWSKQTIIMMVVIILCVIGTVAAIVWKAYTLSKKAQPEPIADTVLKQDDTKKADPDDKYKIKDLNDTYTQNNLIIKKYDIKDGQVKEDLLNYDIEYIQISGLSNSTIQDTINKELKDTAIAMYGKVEANQQCTVTSTVTSNFSNILSVKINKDLYLKKSQNSVENISSETRGFNYDLNTGEKIPLEKVFVSSAPFNAILSDGIYKFMAWDTDLNYEHTAAQVDQYTNMEVRDTSEYEEEILKVVQSYHDKKGQIEYTISPKGVEIYHLIQPKYDRNKGIEIEFLDWYSNVAIFKRYVSTKSLYTEHDIGKRNIYVCNKPLADNQSSIYQKIGDNLLVDISCFREAITKWEGFAKEVKIDSAINDKVYTHWGQQMDQKVEEWTKEADEDPTKGIVVQGYISMMYHDDDFLAREGKKPYIDVDITWYQTQMASSYFKDPNGLPRLMAEIYRTPKADVESAMLSNGKIEGATTKKGKLILYYDLNGNYLGDNEVVIKQPVTMPNNNIPNHIPTPNITTPQGNS